MIRKALPAIVLTLCTTAATSAHAVPEKASGTLIAQGPDVTWGNLAEGETVRATYGDGKGFYVYDGGNSRKLADDPTLIANWAASDGSVWLFDGRIRFAGPGGNLRTVLEVGDDCPGAGRITAFDGMVYDSPTSLIATIACYSEAFNETRDGIYRVDSDGGVTQFVGWLTPVPGFPTTNEPAVVAKATDWTRSGPGHITFVANVYCEGDPDCPPYVGVTQAAFQTTAGGTPTLLWRPGMVLPGTPAEYADAHLAGAYLGGHSNDKGDLLFRGGSYGSVPPLAWFVLPSGGTVRKVVALNDQPSGAPEPFTEFDRVEIAGNGRVVFTTKDEFNGPWTLWQETLDAQRRILHPGSILPGTPGDEVESIKDWRVSPTGRLAIIANTKEGVYGREVLLVTNPQGDLEVIWSQVLGGGGSIPIETPTGTIQPEGRMYFGGNFGPTTGVDGYGSVFTSNDRLQVVFVPNSGDRYIVALDLEPAAPAGPEVLLEFELENKTPFEWGDLLRFNAVILNASDVPIERVLLVLETDRYMRFQKPTECLREHASNPGGAYMLCSYDADVPAFGEARLSFRLQTFEHDQDDSFTLTGELTTRHTEGPQGDKQTDSKFTLLATPQVADLQFEIENAQDDLDRVTVVNAGPSEADKVVFTADLHDEDSAFGTYGSLAGLGCKVSADGAQATCELASLPVGERITFPFPFGSHGRARIDVASDDDDPNPANNKGLVWIATGEDPLAPLTGGGCRTAVGGQPGAGAFGLLLLALGARRRKKHFATGEPGFA